MGPTHTVGTRDDAEQIQARRWWILGTLCVCLIVIGVDNTILNVALPSIVRDLNASGSQLQWMVDAYTIVFACLLLTAGSLGDRYGRKHALSFGLVWFGACSALASRASSPEMLIGARALMGVGGAFIFPTTLSILTNTFRDPNERARAIGIWAGVAGIGIAIGPLAGGLLVEHFGWSSVFLINVPVCAAALVLTRLLIPNSGDRGESPLDPVGALLSIVGLVGVLYAIIEAPNVGWTAPEVLGGFVVGIGFIATFALWEWRNPHPMLDVRFFRNPRFSAASGTITLTYFALFASTFLLTQYFQFILGYSPLKSGLMLTPVAIGLMIGSPSAPRLVVRHGTKRVVVAGLIVIACCMACYGSNTIMSSFTIGFVVRLIYGIGMGITTAPVTESIMGSLPPARAGVGSAVNDTTRQTGGALGVAMLGSVFAARYHQVIDAARNVPAGILRQGRDSIGTSLQVANRHRDTSGAALRVAARHAFLSSMRVTYALAVVIVLGAAAFAAKFLPARAAPVEAPVDADDTAAALFVGAENAAR
jgi:EmrB/QacA subfamily drug resistance transporter